MRPRACKPKGGTYQTHPPPNQVRGWDTRRMTLDPPKVQCRVLEASAGIRAIVGADVGWVMVGHLRCLGSGGSTIKGTGQKAPFQASRPSPISQRGLK